MQTRGEGEGPVVGQGMGAATQRLPRVLLSPPNVAGVIALLGNINVIQRCITCRCVVECQPSG